MKTIVKLLAWVTGAVVLPALREQVQDETRKLEQKLQEKIEEKLGNELQKLFRKE